jgi:uncharacterized protein YndB with AHSA1/START domain
MKIFAAPLLFTGLLLSPILSAEVVSSSDTHFVLRQEAESSLPPEGLWQRLIRPANWWHPDHTYSGDASNLSLVAEAGGLWREDWPGGSVAHGEVKAVRHGELLRLEAPFGPLQGLGAYTIWTITIEPAEGGSRVIFDEVATAPPGSGMTEMAKAVDYVKGEGIRRLVSGGAD